MMVVVVRIAVVAWLKTRSGRRGGAHDGGSSFGSAGSCCPSIVMSFYCSTVMHFVLVNSKGKVRTKDTTNTPNSCRR